MANSVTSSKAVANSPWLVQEIVFSIDTSASAVSQDLLINQEPDMAIVRCSSVGTATVQTEVTYDTTDWEVDFQVLVEGGGTIGTHEFTVYLVYFAQAVGGIS